MLLNEILTEQVDKFITFKLQHGVEAKLTLESRKPRSIDFEIKYASVNYYLVGRKIDPAKEDKMLAIIAEKIKRLDDSVYNPNVIRSWSTAISDQKKKFKEAVTQAIEDVVDDFSE